MFHYILSARFARGRDEILSYTASGYLCAISIERDGTKLLLVPVWALGSSRKWYMLCSNKLKSSKMCISVLDF